MSGWEPGICEIDPGLGEFVNDVVYNLHGNRLATCSANGSISVLERNSNEDPWKIIWKKNEAHRAAIFKIEWALPELGQIVATCSSDRTIKIWEEDKEALYEGLNKDWVERQVLIPPEAPFTCMKFARSKDFEGLICSTMDGTILMYTLVKTLGPFSLEFMNSFNVFLEPSPLGEHYVAVSSSPRRSLMIAAACKSLNTVKLICATHSSWYVFAELPGHTDAVLDVSWAYNIGLEHELIATGCADGHVRIFKLSINTSSSKPTNKYQLVLTADNDDHKGKVHQVAWNYMSTVLSSAGEDSRILQWKASMLGEWSCFSVIHP